MYILLEYSSETLVNHMETMLSAVVCISMNLILSGKIIGENGLFENIETVATKYFHNWR